ncbi:hypothetical protein ACIPWI_06875 [Streptomyces sp. NPDC090046]|uniref:hypothetical protein n=1 Tax=Streptomyces sp. NPDC090046 TaxID=3365928 RepID=UPI003818BFCB
MISGTSAGSCRKSPPTAANMNRIRGDGSRASATSASTSAVLFSITAARCSITGEATAAAVISRSRARELIQRA